MDNSEFLALFSSGTSMVVSLIIAVIAIIAMWKIFTKAGEAGWKSIVPFLNTYVLFKIVWGNGWLFLLLLIPFVNIVIMLIANWKLCKAFGYGIGMFILSIFFPGIPQLIIGFGSHGYLGVQ